MSNSTSLLISRHRLNFETDDEDNSDNSASNYEELEDSQDKEEESDSGYISAEKMPPKAKAPSASKKVQISQAQ